jgi:hypothetical protein
MRVSTLPVVSTVAASVLAASICDAAPPPALEGLTPDDTLRAVADEVKGTVQIYVEQRTQRGETHACGVVFVSVVADALGNRGRPTRIDGSVMFWHAEGKLPFASFKVVGTDFVPAANASNLKLQPFKIDYAYLIAGPVNTAGKEQTRFECEGEGLCSATTEHIAEILDYMIQGRLELAYQRCPTCSDQRVPIRWVGSHEQQRTEQVKLLNCTGELISKWGEDIEKAERR